MNLTSILQLPDGVEINRVFVDPQTSIVLIGLSDGRILRMDSAQMNAYLTGQRSIYVQLLDGMGNVSEIISRDLLYRLHNRIVKVDENRRILKSYEVELPSSAIEQSEVSGVFTSPVLFGGQDFGFWEEVRWQQVVPTGTSVKVGVRVAETVDETLLSPWYYFDNEGRSSSSSSSTADETYQSGNLDQFNIQGKYIQLKVILQTSTRFVTPSVVSLQALYRTKFAVYFFTNKFVLDRNSNLSSGIITGTVSAPQFTEVKFGVTGSNSSDWNDYQVVDLDQSFALPSTVKNRIKMGIKMIAYQPTIYPEVSDFALMLGAEETNLMNWFSSSSSSSP